jgi:hypothetical protein
MNQTTKPGHIPVPQGIKATDRFLGTFSVAGTVLRMTAGPLVPLVSVTFTCAPAATPDVHQPQPLLHMTVEQAGELAALLAAAAELASQASGTSSAPSH